MSILNFFRSNLATLQQNVCEGLPTYGVLNLNEKLFSLFLFDGLSSSTVLHFLQQH